MILIRDWINKLLILFLNRFVFNNVLVLYNAKKKINIIILTSKNITIDKNI